VTDSFDLRYAIEHVFALVENEAAGPRRKTLAMAVALSRAERRIALDAVVEGLGYHADLVERDFPIWTGDTIGRPDLVGFGRPAPKDMTTATLLGAVVDSPEEAAECRAWARAIASPASLLWLPDGLEVWAIAPTEQGDRRVDAVAHGFAPDIFQRLGPSLEPGELLGAKHAGRQLSLFPIDVGLLARAREVSASQLTTLVNEAMTTTLGSTAASRVSARAFGEASRLVIGAMAALMVRDKLGESASVPVDSAFALFPEYFSWISGLSAPNRARFYAAAEVLGSGVDYSGLDPTVVSHVYETSVVSKLARRKLGIYYTPPDLARRIVEEIPFEALATQDCMVMDPACGSGTMLLAAHNRLRPLAPGNFFDQHEFLRTHLVGYDADYFAVEIAKLALLLNALPAGDSWLIRQGDSTAILTTHRESPSIIVTNPPWENIRSKGGKRVERADEFVIQAARAVSDHGFLALVLPAPWLSSETSAKARAQFQQVASIFEIWRLPEGTFGGAQYAPCVVFAQKKTPHRPFVFRRIMRRTALKEFYRSRRAERVYLSSPARGLRPASLLRGPLDALAEQLSKYPKLASLAEVSSGPVPLPPAADRGKSGKYLWLPEAGAVVPFGGVPESALGRVDYPDDFSRRGQNVEQFLRPKLLVSKMRNPDNPWRIRVGLDTLGVIPRQSLFTIAPRRADDEEATRFALLAILGSAIASCWVDTLAPRMDIPTQVMKSLPVPASGDAWRALTTIGRELYAAADERALTREALTKLEEVTAAAYRLSDEDRERVWRHFAGFRAADGFVRFDERTTAANETPASRDVPLTRYGAVTAVKEGAVRVWIPGLTSEDGDWVSLPPLMRGWLAEEGRTFRVADVEGHDLALGIYDFQPLTDRALGELVKEHDRIRSG
jgi:hypothetical protein